MKTVCELDYCAGCMACVESCPVNAIEIKDGIVSLNSVINEEKCINCNACTRVCPQINIPDFRNPIEWFQGWTNGDTRINSSSGGFAYSLMHTFIESGGIVCTCVFDQGVFGFKLLHKIDQVQEAVGSKYVKSNPAGIYKEVRKYLSEGTKVLMIGLPCQIAAMISFCGEKYSDNLYTVDLICHGSPSPVILGTYLKEQGYDLNQIHQIDFRKKNLFGLRINQKKILPDKVRDRYTIGFLNGTFYTENCYHCQYARKERISDLTIGDSWGSELSEEEKQAGISLVLCQSEKGLTLLKNSHLILKQVDIEKAVAANHQLAHPSIKTQEHDVFFHNYWRGKGVSESITKCYKKQCFRQDVKMLLYRVHLIK